MLRRSARILCGYLASCCVPHVPLFLLSGDPEAIVGMLHPMTIAVVAIFALYVTFIPAAVVITIGELLQIRRWYYYVLGAGLSSQMQILTGTQYTMSNIDMMGIFFMGGCLSGSAYWAISGRKAGPGHIGGSATA
jgi:hypothetical protein